MSPRSASSWSQAITALSATLLGAPADDVVLAPPRSVLKTSSGKTRRAACRALYEQGRLGVTQRAPWRAMARAGGQRRGSAVTPRACAKPAAGPGACGPGRCSARWAPRHGAR